ncbi:MAG: ribose-5-phosphate isomerase RpiA [Pseudomonadota bacterium]
MADPDPAKLAVARAAVMEVEPGMAVGLGTGSTATLMVDALADRVRAGLDIVGVPTSSVTERQARGLGIPLSTLAETPVLDLTIDGADEIGPDLALIKGAGGALLQEKIVAESSRRMLVIVDASKDVEVLGAFTLPVEVVRFGHETTRMRLAAELARQGMGGAPIALRLRDGKPYVTDEGHYLFDLSLGRIPDPAALDGALNAVTGIVETGLFVGLASVALIGQADGTVHRRTA